MGDLSQGNCVFRDAQRDQLAVGRDGGLLDRDCGGACGGDDELAVVGEGGVELAGGGGEELARFEGLDWGVSRWVIFVHGFPDLFLVRGCSVLQEYRGPAMNSC